MNTHKAIAVANYLLMRAVKQNKTLTPMQLIKLVYLCHGWMFGLYGRPLLSESVEAWRYGPVIRSLYQVVSMYGDLPVKYPLGSFFGKKNASITQAEFDDDQRNVMDQVFDLYGDLSGIELSHMTHQPDSPWSNIYREKGRNSVIPNDLIEYHYKKLYQSQGEAESN